VIDADGFRPNVGIILANAAGQVLWAKRIRQDAWQFPQGGIQRGETPDQALYRHPVCIGQKQKWFLLRMLCEECLVHFDSSAHPEFDGWRWVDYWLPLQEVVVFKREVYREALNQLAPLLGLEAQAAKA
jgi:putative (di)nucleoside polyphosphate hydrolase